MTREAHTSASAELGTAFLRQSAGTQVFPLISFYILISLRSGWSLICCQPGGSCNVLVLSWKYLIQFLSLTASYFMYSQEEYITKICSGLKDLF